METETRFCFYSRKLNDDMETETRFRFYSNSFLETEMCFQETRFRFYGNSFPLACLWSIVQKMIPPKKGG